MYGEGIIERLHEKCSLRNTDNPMRKVFVNTIGSLLDKFDIYGSMEAPFLQNAEGVYLDLQGNDMNVKRRLDESDEDYRKRIVYEVLGVLTVAYLLEVYDLVLYAFVEDFSLNGLTLTSDNPYLNEGNGFMTVASDEIQALLESKFVLGEGLEWLTA